MSTFKQYLAESTKVYNFKVKIAGDIDKKVSEQMRIALSKYDCGKVSGAKRTPITETPLDFPDQRFSHVNIFDVSCNYPTTAHEMGILLAEKLKINASRIRVKSESEDMEYQHNQQDYNRIGSKGEALLLKPELESVSAQDQVGQNRLMTFIKELSKNSHKGEQVKGINDQLLAKSAPTGSAQK